MNINKDYLDTIIDELNMMIVVISKDNTLLSANKVMLEFAGVSLDEVIDVPLWELPWLQDDPDLQNKLLFALTDSYMGTDTRFNAKYKNSKGEDHEIDFIIRPVMKDGEPEYFIAMGYNITDLVKARKALTERDRRIKAFFDYSSEGYFFLSLPDKVDKTLVTDQIVSEVIEHFKLEDVNNRLVEILGKAINCPETLFENLKLDLELHETIKHMILKGSYTYQETIVVNEEIKHIQMMIVAIYDEGHFEGCFGIIRDITEQIDYIEKVEYLANKDYLTGINNRRNFFHEGQLLYDEHKRTEKPLTVVMFDIDHFKKVNDTYGHDAGDVVIRDLAKLVSENLGEGCVFGRYGGEEYIVLLPQSMKEVYKLFETLRKAISEYSFKSGHTVVHVTISLGLYDIDFEEDTLEGGITKADKALYESKQNGRNQSTIFIESIHGSSSQDPLTGLYTEQTMKYKLAKSLNDIKSLGESMWIIYFKLNVMKEDRLLIEDRQYRTLAISMKKSVRATDYVGRIGTNGFMAVLRNVNVKQVDDKLHHMIENIDIGFSGMINNVVTIKSCALNASEIRNVDELLKEIKENLHNLY